MMRRNAIKDHKEVRKNEGLWVQVGEVRISNPISSKFVTATTAPKRMPKIR